MEYSFEIDEPVVILHIEGNVLTGVYNEEILNKVSDKISEGSNKMVINLGSTKFTNSNGLNLLLNILTKCRKAGGEVVLSNVPDELSKLLVITKLDSIFIVRDSKEQAANYLKES